jgi:beta-ketodecanoyl-[acyl-carrier-protein] synthase
MTNNVWLTGSAVYVPEEVISNEELVACFNQYVHDFNLLHAKAIAASEMEPLRESSDAFIVKASGIKQRHVVDKKNILDVNIMAPRLAEREPEQLSLQAEMAVKAAQKALLNAGKTAADIDFVLVACSNFQRAYPAMSIEVQAALGIAGYAYDMNVACSSATFAMQAAVDAIAMKHASAALVINPEITSAHLNYRDRDSHFIFGDACTAIVLEAASEKAQQSDAFAVLSSKLHTQFSNNIRNNFGFLNNMSPDTRDATDKLFMQNGRQVFKEISPLAAKFIVQHLAENNLTAEQVKRFWMHQANANMNQLIMEKILGVPATFEQAPTILQDYANTSSAGSIICFNQYHNDLQSGDIGLISSFGAGYSIGSVLLRKL